MEGWVGLVGWPIRDSLNDKVVTCRPYIGHRLGKVRRPKTDIVTTDVHWQEGCITTNQPYTKSNTRPSAKQYAAPNQQYARVVRIQSYSCEAVLLHSFHSFLVYCLVSAFYCRFSTPLYVVVTLWASVLFYFLLNAYFQQFSIPSITRSLCMHVPIQ